jgi:hypothetical protein
MKTKKIILFIVEGKTDKIALGMAIQNCFADKADSIRIEFTCVGGDILGKYEGQKTNVKNVIPAIEAKVKEVIKREHLKATDISHVIQIIDTDGVFVQNINNLKSDETCEHFFYGESTIAAKERAWILKRNIVRIANIEKLLGTKEICKIPYQLFFMSCNLDHVIANERNLPKKDKVKEKIATNFEREIGANKTLFENFLKEHLTPGASTFEESWDYLKIGTHSLDRHTNLYFAINGTNS